jgi:hypothetical protein
MKIGITITGIVLPSVCSSLENRHEEDRTVMEVTKLHLCVDREIVYF